MIKNVYLNIKKQNSLTTILILFLSIGLVVLSVVFFSFFFFILLALIIPFYLFVYIYKKFVTKKSYADLNFQNNHDEGDSNNKVTIIDAKYRKND